MTRSALRRITEAFFQRWPFYALLLLASLAIGYSQVQRTADLYVSNGAIAVDDETLVTAQSGVRSGPSFNYLSPAQFTSQELYGLIVTDVFMESVTESAGLELSTQPAIRAAELQELRLAMSVYPSSGNILKIDATTTDPQLSADLVQAVIDEFIKFQIRIDIAESEASEEFFTELAESYRQDVVDARAEVDAELRGIESLNDISPERELRIDRLKQAEAQADSRYQEVVQDVEVAQLAALQTETDIRQSYSVLDIPEPASEAGGRLFNDLVTLAMFGLVGAILAVLLPVFSALTNRTLVFADDLDPVGPAQVSATIPRVRKRDLDLKRVGAVEQVPVGRLAPPLGPPDRSQAKPGQSRSEPAAAMPAEVAVPAGADAGPVVPANKAAAGDVVEPVVAAVSVADAADVEPVVAAVSVADAADVEPVVAAVSVADAPVVRAVEAVSGQAENTESETEDADGSAADQAADDDLASRAEDGGSDADTDREAVGASDQNGGGSPDTTGEASAEDDDASPLDASPSTPGPSTRSSIEEAGQTEAGLASPATATELMVELHDLEFDSYPEDLAETSGGGNGGGNGHHGQDGRNGTNGGHDKEGHDDA